MRFVVVMALVQVMGTVSAAQAAGSEDSAEGNKVAARAEWRQANVAYNLGHYDEAAKHFEAAYTLVQDSAFLFNIAQSYRMGGKLDQALDRYRAFLRTGRADARIATWREARGGKSSASSMRRRNPRPSRHPRLHQSRKPRRLLLR